MLKHFCLSATLLVFAVCAYATIGYATDEKAAPSTQPINKMCAVEHDDPIDPSITVEYKGKIIGFCCKDCPPKFKADPEKYMKDLK